MLKIGKIREKKGQKLNQINQNVSHRYGKKNLL